MFLTDRVKEWHESDGLLSSLSDYWEVQPTWNQAGVPKNLRSSGNYSSGNSGVNKVRLGDEHTIFSKRGEGFSATITQYIAAQFAYHLEFPLAPVLAGPERDEIHSLRMVFNVRSGSLFQAMVQKIKDGDPDVPQELREEYEEREAYVAKQKLKYRRPYSQRELFIATRDSPEVRAWSDKEINNVYGANRDVMSRRVAFNAMVADDESITNTGNVIVSLNDPTEILYFIDSHPNLQSFSTDLSQRSIPHRIICDDGRYFHQTDAAKGNVDYDVIERELEVFKEAMTDDVIDQTILKASMLAGRLLGTDSSFGIDAQYFGQLRDFYKIRRDGLVCEF